MVKMNGGRLSHLFFNHLPFGFHLIEWQFLHMFVFCSKGFFHGLEAFGEFGVGFA